MDNQNPVANRDTIVLRQWSDLEQFGIHCLTGEACAFSMRLLCDVNEDGLALLADFWGVPELEAAPPMNHTVNKKPAIGSVMLARSCFHDLAHFAFFADGALAYYDANANERTYGQELIGIYSEDRLKQYVDNNMNLRRNHALASRQPRVGSRNVHQATGRAI